jgi:hypothetical protein
MRVRTVGRARMRKIKSVNTQTQQDTTDVFYMSLEEAKAAIADKYEFLAERYEQKFPKHKGLS